MVPVPMRPAQNALVIIATFLVAGSLLPWAPRFRLACAAGVIGIVLLLLIARMRAHAGAVRAQNVDGTLSRIERIRAERAARIRRRR